MEVHTSFSTVHTSKHLNLIFLGLTTSCRGAFMPHPPLPFTSGTLVVRQLLPTSENKMLSWKCGKRKEEVGNKQPKDIKYQICAVATEKPSSSYECFHIHIYSSDNCK